MRYRDHSIKAIHAFCGSRTEKLLNLLLLIDMVFKDVKHIYMGFSNSDANEFNET